MQIPKLKKWRETKGETQVSLSELSGIAEHTISRIEHGAGTRPSTARKLANSLGVTVADLMEDPPVPVTGAVFSSKAEAAETRPAAYAEGEILYFAHYDDMDTGEMQDVIKDARGRMPKGASLRIDFDDKEGAVEVSVQSDASDEATTLEGARSPKSPRYRRSL